MSSTCDKPRTEGALSFDPDDLFACWSDGRLTPPTDDDFRGCITKAFGLHPNDTYKYVAIAEVTLLQAQAHVDHGARGELHVWYRDAQSQSRGSPSQLDIAAYIDVFRATTNTPKALVGLGSNAKKDSLRADVARHLNSLFKPAASIAIPKRKNHVNPYFDVWAWTCANLEWGGPEDGTVRIKTSHAVLPVLYHHFGCVVPSYEALFLIQHLANDRRILDMGSGNGYWTYMLRSGTLTTTSKNKPKLQIIPIDNGLSQWRTMWIGDTIKADGVQWLRQNDGGQSDVLLLVYPVVGNDFTSQIIKAYRGTTIIAAGSQNASGYTAFVKDTFAGWMNREMPTWNLVLQIPLPSFAGKDEALFVFEKA